MSGISGTSGSGQRSVEGVQAAREQQLSAQIEDRLHSEVQKIRSNLEGSKQRRSAYNPPGTGTVLDILA